jgi:Bacterial mobilisation protein (MobC)
MSESTHLMTWVTRARKARFAHLAHDQGYSESAFLKRLVEGALAASGAAARQLPDRVEPTAASGLLSIRLRSDDLLLLRERAAGRDMPTSTYASLLIRAHLRTLTPLPTAELAALRRSVAEIGAVGRNLNQIARAVNRGEAPTGPSRADLQALIRALAGCAIISKP